MELLDFLTFDCETTGLPPKGAKWETDFIDFPYLVQLAWSFNGVEKEYIIKPDGYVVPDEAAAIHGITNDIALQNGVPLLNVINEFISDCLLFDVIVAHNIYFDTSTIKANIMRLGYQDLIESMEEALHKDKRVDTMMKCIKFVGATFPNSSRLKFPSLEELYLKLFNEGFEAHTAIEDVRAVNRCIPELVSLGIIELKRRQPLEPGGLFSPTNEKMKVESDEIVLKEKPIDFVDPNPVVVFTEQTKNNIQSIRDVIGIKQKPIIPDATNNLLNKDLDDF